MLVSRRSEAPGPDREVGDAARWHLKAAQAANTLDIRLAATVIYVPSVAEATAFYQRAFGFELVFSSDAGDYAELELGGARLAFDSETLADAEGPPGGYRPNRSEAPPAGYELMVHTGSVAEAMDVAIEAGATQLSPPRKKSWSQEIAYVRDPWGTLIAIGSPWEAGK